VSVQNSSTDLVALLGCPYTSIYTERHLWPSLNNRGWVLIIPANGGKGDISNVGDSQVETFSDAPKRSTSPLRRDTHAYTSGSTSPLHDGINSLAEVEFSLFPGWYQEWRIILYLATNVSFQTRIIGVLNGEALQVTSCIVITSSHLLGATL
jgi:hypothetical protein